VQETRIKSRAGGDKLVWQWYYVHGFMVSNDYIARLVNGWGMLRGDQAITVLVVAAAVNGSYENARALLLRFVTDTRPALERAIDEMGMP
jgi:EpsI family protein